MRRVVGLLSAVFEFIVGDDPLTALGAGLAVALTALAAAAGAAAWWIMALAVPALLALSVLRAARRATTGGRPRQRHARSAGAPRSGRG